MKSKSFLKNMRKAVAVIAGLLLLLAFAQCKKEKEKTEEEINQELTIETIQFIGDHLQEQFDRLSGKSTPEVMEALAEWLIGQDGVAAAVPNESWVMITYVDGTEASIEVYDQTLKPDIPAREEKRYDGFLSDTDFHSFGRQQNTNVVGSQKVLIFDAFPLMDPEIGAGDAIHALFHNAGCQEVDHPRGSQCTIELLRNMTQYGYVQFITHGSATDGIATGEVVTVESWLSHVWDLAHHRVRTGYFAYKIENGIKYRDKYFVITNKFIENLSDDFDNSIIFSFACKGFIVGDAPIKDAFLAKRAATYFGFDNKNGSEHGYEASSRLVNTLLAGNSVGDAYNSIENDNWLCVGYGSPNEVGEIIPEYTTCLHMDGATDVTWYETPPTSAPVVTTNEVSAENIATTTATVSGSVVFPEPSQPIEYERGFVYGTSSEGLVVGEADQVVYPGTELLNFSCTLTDLLPNTMYYVRAYSRWENNEVIYGDVVSFTTLSTGGDTYDYVDLGLPSGTLWATCNLGANTPEEYGDYFAWGETQPKVNYSWGTYQYCNGDWDQLTKYCSNSSYGYNDYTDNLTILETNDDAATANWGTGWRMPTIEEYNELYQNTIHTWTTQNGVNGNKFTALNGNSLFLPAAGCRLESSLFGADSYGLYWSSSLSTDNPDRAWYFSAISNSYSMSYDYRFGGFSVRPVRSAH